MSPCATVMGVNQEPALKKQRTDAACESVFFKGVDGADNEYCPYTETSKAYDTTRAPLGLNVFLGSMVLIGTPLHEQDLLDVGCGTGTFLEELKENVGSVTGLEYNDGMIAEARSRLGNDPKVKQLVQGSADALPFPDNSFHVVTMNQVAHHFPKDNDYSFCLKVFKEISRVLKPGGAFILNTSTPEQQRDAFWWLSLFPRASKAICERFPPLETLTQHCKSAGLLVTADSVCVPLHRSLMADSKYLEHGVKGAFLPEYRAGDSSWSMAENFGELDAGLNQLQTMIDKGTAEAWLQGREDLRKRLGQATFLSVRKPDARKPATPQ